MSCPFEVDHVFRLLELEQVQAEEVRALRVEAERQTELLRRILERLESIERTQYS
jgi:hypothetical protein